MANSIKKLFKDVSFILKFTVMILLAVATFITAYDGIHTRSGTVELFEVGVYVQLIVMIGLLALYVFQEPHQLYNLAYLLCGGVIDIMMGILTLMYWGDSNSNSDSHMLTLIVGIFVLGSGAIMITDFILTLIKK